ncbi:MAG TPA: ATP-binding protein [Kofleriaceae bacterium]|jgi:signal transduction histidine kinase
MSRTDEIFLDDIQRLHRRTDRMFQWLLLAQWVFAVGVALIDSPWSWSGTTRTLHIHVKAALVFGGLINVLPILLVRFRPGWWGTRQSIAAVQMLWSALLIMITGGRIETHFHVFGSLAFLAFYRDWRVLQTATAVVALDHLVRGLWWPDSVYGVANAEWWRFLEHAGWVMFENVFLAYSCVRSLREMKNSADREARLERTNAIVEREVADRTRELKQEMEHRTKVELELRQAQKLEAVGRLAAGVAHEINTPVQFVSDSCVFLQEASAEIAVLVAEHRELLSADQRRDLDELTGEMTEAFARAMDGLGRVAGIVGAMKEFAYPDRIEMAPADVNRAITSTLTVARNEYKYVADVVTELDELPPVVCHLGDLNQAMLNMIVNAAHAIEARVAAGERGEIAIATRAVDDQVVISIRDNGCGIPAEDLDKIFDPFFTTKPLGKGSGQGLAIARSVVVEKHAGRISVDSAVGQGTTFTISLPIAAAA